MSDIQRQLSYINERNKEKEEEYTRQIEHLTIRIKHSESEYERLKAAQGLGKEEYMNKCDVQLVEEKNRYI